MGLNDLLERYNGYIAQPYMEHGWRIKWALLVVFIAVGAKDMIAMRGLMKKGETAHEHLKSGNLTEANELVSELLESNQLAPGHPIVNNLAMLLGDLNRHADSITLLERYGERRPRSVMPNMYAEMPHMLMARSHHTLGDLDSAREHQRKASEARIESGGKEGPQGLRAQSSDAQWQLTSRQALRLEGARIISEGSTEAPEIILIDDFLSPEELAALRVLDNAPPPVRRICFTAGDTRLDKLLEDGVLAEADVGAKSRGGVRCTTEAIDKVEPHLKMAEVVMVQEGTHAAVDAVNRRVLKAAGLFAEQGKETTLITQLEGVAIAAQPPCNFLEHEPSKNERLVTTLLFIDEPEAGGEEQFPHLPGLEDFVAPAGSLMLVRTLDEYGGCELRSTRGSAEVKKGVKRALSRAFFVDVVEQQPYSPNRRNDIPVVCDANACLKQYVAEKKLDTA